VQRDEFCSEAIAATQPWEVPGQPFNCEIHLQPLEDVRDMMRGQTNQNGVSSVLARLSHREKQRRLNRLRLNNIRDGLTPCKRWLSPWPRPGRPGKRSLQLIWMRRGGAKAPRAPGCRRPAPPGSRSLWCGGRGALRWRTNAWGNDLGVLGDGSLERVHLVSHGAAAALLGASAARPRRPDCARRVLAGDRRGAAGAGAPAIPLVAAGA
jgi:hypothetical protein